VANIRGLGNAFQRNAHAISALGRQGSEESNAVTWRAFAQPFALTVGEAAAVLRAMRPRLTQHPHDFNDLASNDLFRVDFKRCSPLFDRLTGGEIPGLVFHERVEKRGLG
jgi:uncharacterized protein (DUF2236 family)